MVVVIGKVTYVGNSSMEVRVDTYVEHLEDGMRHAINRAYFTMVALDENDKPKRVPRLILDVFKLVFQNRAYGIPNSHSRDEQTRASCHTRHRHDKPTLIQKQIARSGLGCKVQPLP